IKGTSELEKTHHEPTPHTNTGNIVYDPDTDTYTNANSNPDSSGAGGGSGDGSAGQSPVWDGIKLGLILTLSAVLLLVVIGFTVILCKRIRNRRALKGNGEDWQSLSSDADFELRYRSDAVLDDLGDDDDVEPLNLGQDDEGNWIGDDGDHKLIQG
ncbi:hypothetical protein SARC_16843, partial [Sphaeroforma arctica JP610]